MNTTTVAPQHNNTATTTTPEEQLAATLQRRLKQNQSLLDARTRRLAKCVKGSNRYKQIELRCASLRRRREAQQRLYARLLKEYPHVKEEREDIQAQIKALENRLYGKKAT